VILEAALFRLIYGLGTCRKFEQDCYANLEKLNARCDRLRRLTVRLNILLLSFVLNVHVLFY